MGYYRTGAYNFSRGRPLAQMGYKPRRPYRGPAGGYKKPQTGAPVRQGYRVRRAGAVATQQRRRRKINRPVKTGDNSSFSFFKLRSKWNPKLKPLYRLVQGRQVVQSQESNSTTCGTGRQGTIGFNFLSKTDLTTIQTTCNGGTATNNAVRCFLGHVKSKASFKNQSNCVCKLILYDLVCKRTAPSTSMDDPREPWTQGYIDFGGGVTINMVNNTPTLSPEFRNQWSIKKVTTVMLEPGQQHDHTHYRTINRVVDSTVWAHAPGESVAYLTSALMATFHGSLIHESATPTTVSTADVRIDYMIHEEFGFGYIARNTPSLVQSSVITNTITDPDFMGETGDADVNVNNA